VSRVVGVLAIAALASALCFAASRSAAAAQGSERFDFGPQLMLRLFGENTDAAASFAATQGDRASESPLRELALDIGSPGEKHDFGGVAATFGEERFGLQELAGGTVAGFATPIEPDEERSAPHFAPLPGPQDDVSVFSPANGHFLAAYQPLPPIASVSPAPGAVAFALTDVHAPAFLQTTAQIGAVHFQGGDNGPAGDTPQASLPDTSYDAGANVDVRAGKRTVNLNLSSEYEHVGPSSANAFSLGTADSASSLQLPGGAPLVIPNASDLNRLSLGAGFSVPVTRALTLNFNYDAQHLYGGYGLPGLVNLDTIDNSYGGKLTFNIPRISSSLSISAYQDRIQDSILSLNGYNGTREDVNFTVKF
jgi:hypothetical protein